MLIVGDELAMDVMLEGNELTTEVLPGTELTIDVLSPGTELTTDVLFPGTELTMDVLLSGTELVTDVKIWDAEVKVVVARVTVTPPSVAVVIGKEPVAEDVEVTNVAEAVLVVGKGSTKVDAVTVPDAQAYSVTVSVTVLIPWWP